MEDQNQRSSSIIMAALSTLTPTQFSDLTHSLSSDFRLQNHRIFSLLTSPIRFSLTLQFLQTLSLHDKTFLIARYLLKTLKQLTMIWESKTQTSLNLTNMGSSRIRLRDSDAICLLMLLSEFRHQDNSNILQSCSFSEWRRILNDYLFKNTLMSISGLGASSTNLVVCSYIDIAIKCRRFLHAMMSCSNGNGPDLAMSRGVAASPSAVVALRWVEAKGEGEECAICKEEMREGRDVCEMPCEHLFHWICILPWLKMRNTCPCCRLQIPTDDVLGEIDRLWSLLIKKGCINGRNCCGEL